MASNQEYIAEYKEFAKEQMKRYGIPASVTLAQGILESANGKSELSRLGNNHFGVKASRSWLESGGGYLVYDDDKPNEKFCKYNSVSDSYEHHSRILANSKHYTACFKCAPDDYVGWTNGLQKGGYATNKQYASSLQDVIKKNNLQDIDKEVIEEMKKEGKTVGVEGNPRKVAASSAETPSKTNKSTSSERTPVDNQRKYSFPLKRNEFMLVTSGFGNRKDPMNPEKTQFHKGIDIKTRHEAVLATENNGKVVSVNHNVNTGGGKSVTIEYDRADGTKYQCTYMHLSSIDVKKDDIVKAGQKVGVSGNTGTRTTGEHLHFGVKNLSADGTKHDMDPAAYLAEIAVKGNIAIEAQHNGKDLIAKYRSSVDLDNDKPVSNSVAESSPDEWMKKLLCSEDSGLSQSEDPVIAYAMMMFTSLMAMAVQIDGKSNEEKNQTITDSLVTRSLDLSSLLPKLQQPELKVMDDGRMSLSYSEGGRQRTFVLTDSQKSQLGSILNDSSLSLEQKQQSVNSIVTGIIASQKASENYAQMNNVQQESRESIQRR